VLQDDPILPAPTAGAIVAHVRQLPIGADLAALDVTLQRLRGRSSAEMTTSEWRVTAMGRRFALPGLLCYNHLRQLKATQLSQSQHKRG
jgi:hypothetical protein